MSRRRPPAARWATFDCYGTLIDWERGISDSLSSLWPSADRAKLLSRYHDVEPRLQEGSGRSYREVLEAAVVEVARAEALPVPSEGERALVESLPTWPPFPEVPDRLRELRARGWKMAILSNSDPDLLATSIRQLGVEPDLAVTVHEAGSYKPAHRHWLVFRKLSEADPSRHVHVAASTFHDLAPCAELGITAVWINRLGERTHLPRAAELSDLTDLPDTLDGLVPA